MFNISKKDFRKIDKLLMFSMLALITFGLLVLRSAVNATSGSINSQIISTIVGFIVMIVIFFVDLDFIKKIKWFIYAMIVLALAATLVFGYGTDLWGAKSWIKIGPLSMQPSEFVKMGLIIVLASYLDDNKSKIGTWFFCLKYFIVAGIPIFLIMKQPDFGTSMVFIFIILTMFFVAGFPFKKIAILAGVGLTVLLISLPILWSKMDDFQKERILNFLDSGRDVTGTGYQAYQGSIALGSGKLTGRGYMKGPFTQNRYLPEQHTDFIFPVLAEEFGFLGGIIAISLFLLLLSRILKISRKSTSIFDSTMTIGILALLFIHIFENIGMTLGVMPITGIPLPFFSNGGTFQIVNISCIALVLSVNMQRKTLDF